MKPKGLSVEKNDRGAIVKLSVPDEDIIGSLAWIQNRRPKTNGALIVIKALTSLSWLLIIFAMMIKAEEGTYGQNAMFWKQDLSRIAWHTAFFDMCSVLIASNAPICVAGFLFCWVSTKKITRELVEVLILSGLSVAMAYVLYTYW